MVVDGSNLLFQMFFGMPARIVNREGKAIHGTLGFVGALLRIIRRVDPTHVAVLFDGECRNARKDLDEDYKANRPGWEEGEDTPFQQLPDIYMALDYLGICHRETETCEADDWIAGYALQWEGNTVIASFDSDYFQLLSNRVQVLRYRGEKTVLCNPKWLQEKYGILPEQYATFKSLTGDTADNIRGVPLFLYFLSFHDKSANNYCILPDLLFFLLPLSLQHIPAHVYEYNHGSDKNL